MKQQDILDMIVNSSNYTSEDLFLMIEQYTKSDIFQSNSFLESVSEEYPGSLLINIVCYARLDVAYDMMKKMSKFNINWFEKYEYNSYVDFAIANDNVDILQFLIENTEWKNAIQHYLVPGALPVIHYACEQNSIQCLTYLIEHLDLDINQAHENYGNALSIAALNGSLECVQYLIEHTDINQFYDFGVGHHLLFTAISSGNILLVKYLVELNIYDLYSVNQYGENLFQHLLEETEGVNSFDYLFPFFKDSLNMEFKNKEGEHYFFYLLKNGNQANLYSLLTNSDIDITHIVSPIDHQDLLMKASIQGSVEFITYLIEQKNLNPRKNTVDNQNVLTNAVSGSNFELVQYYLDNGYHLDIHSFEQCFNILKQKKESYKKEGNFMSLFYEQDRNSDIENKLNQYYDILLEKKSLEQSFSLDKKNNKKLKV